MLDKGGFRFVDIQNKTVSVEIELIFPGWEPGDERVVVLAPHDDDGVLGAGHAILAAQAFGGEVHVVIFCNGCLGYSSIEEKDSIVEKRRGETLAAYETIGVPKENIHRMDYDDLSVLPHLGWTLPDGSPGASCRVVALLRKLKTTRLLIPNGYREHIDHDAVSRTGEYDAPQVGDPIVAEIGFANPVKDTLKYSVWGDFSPEEALVDGRDLSIRANTLILCDSGIAVRLNDAIAKWRSQARIIKGLVEAREARRYGRYKMEVYMKFDPRPTLDYAPYVRFLESTLGGQL